MSVLGSTSRNVLRRARVNVRSCAASSATWHEKCIGYSWLLEPLLLPSRGLDRHRSISGSPSRYKPSRRHLAPSGATITDGWRKGGNSGTADGKSADVAG